MKPGDPFLTKDLDNLRAQQRRDVRLIEDALAVGDDYKGSGPLRSPLPVLEPRGDEARLAELYMRSRAVELRGQVADQLERMAEAVQAEAAHGVMNRAQGELTHWITDELAHAAEHFRSHDEDVSPEHRAIITRYVALVAFADELADDGYRDPRLPKPAD